MAYAGPPCKRTPEAGEKTPYCVFGTRGRKEMKEKMKKNAHVTKLYIILCSLVRHVAKRIYGGAPPQSATVTRTRPLEPEHQDIELRAHVCMYKRDLEK